MNQSALRAQNYRLRIQRAPSARFSSEGCQRGSFNGQAHDLPAPHLFERNRRPHHRLALASKISSSLSEAQSPRELYEQLARFVFDLLPRVQLVYLFQVAAEPPALACAYAAREVHLRPESLDPAAQPCPAGLEIPLSALRLRRPVVIQDLARFQADNGSPYPTRLYQSLLATPMTRRGEVEGVLEVFSRARRRFGPFEMDLLGLLGNTSAIALETLRLDRHLSESNSQLTQTNDAAVEGWRRALELRDQATEGHGCRVAELTVRLAARLGYTSPELTQLRFGAQLHDIGKIGVPDSVLLKPGPLDDDDTRIMRKHPVYAYEMLSPVPNFQSILDIPFYHHERWDGSGYPRGLQGEQIPRPARIFAVIDVWDALCSDRPYRAAWPEEKAVSYIREQSGKHFDPVVVHEFLEMVVAQELDAVPC